MMKKKSVFFSLFTLIHSAGCWFTLGGLYNNIVFVLLDFMIFLGGQNGHPFKANHHLVIVKLWNPDMRKKTSKKTKLYTFYSFVAIINQGGFYLFIYLFI
jgi:hypothetical protein